MDGTHRQAAKGICRTCLNNEIGKHLKEFADFLDTEVKSVYMVEVFKTNVTRNDQANELISLIHYRFQEYKVNFDLDDCDHILRVESCEKDIQTATLIHLLKDVGFDVEVLQEDDNTCHR